MVNENEKEEVIITQERVTPVRKTSSVPFIIGILVAGVLTLGLLSMMSTRNDVAVVHPKPTVSQSTRDAVNSAKDAVSSSAAVVADKAEDLADKAENAVDRAGNAIDEAVSTSPSDRVEDLADRAEDKVDAAEDAVDDAVSPAQPVVIVN